MCAWRAPLMLVVLCLAPLQAWSALDAGVSDVGAPSAARTGLIAPARANAAKPAALNLRKSLRPVAWLSQVLHIVRSSRFRLGVCASRIRRRQNIRDTGRDLRERPRWIELRLRVPRRVIRGIGLNFGVSEALPQGVLVLRGA